MLHIIKLLNIITDKSHKELFAFILNILFKVNLNSHLDVVARSEMKCRIEVEIHQFYYLRISSTHLNHQSLPGDDDLFV